MKKLASILLFSLSSILVNAAVTLGFDGEQAAQVGIYVKDLATGAVIAANDETKALLPASVMKVVTAATAFSTLPYDFRFETRIYLTGSVSNGICSGNLVIEGCGDPTIDSENFKDMPSLSNEIADALTRKGVKTIKGSVIIKQALSDSGCIPQWEIDDVAWSYGAGLYGFNFRDNTFSLWPATKKTFPEVKNLNVTVRTGKSTDLIRGVNSNNLLVYGTKPNDPKWRVSSTMNSPADIFCDLLKSNLAKSGINVGSKRVDASASQYLMTHYSPELSQILYETLVYSHNLFAEGMLRVIAPNENRRQAIEKELRVWRDRGVPVDYNKILDGSGLSRADRLQPVFIGNVLEWMADSEFSHDFVTLFPRAGVDGTVKSLLADTPLKGKLALKSGSMNAVQCFAGYKLGEDDKPTHVVVILVNAFYCDRNNLRKAIEKFLLNTFDK